MQTDGVLTTQRLRLHLATEDVLAAAGDSPRALSAQLDADISADWLTAGMPLLQNARTRDAAHPSRAVVIHSADRLVIGDIRCERRPGSDPSYEIGYAIVPAYRRNGFAVEAAARVIDWLFAEEGAALVMAGCHMRNRASLRTLRRLGFWLDGASGKAFWWRLTPDLWAEQRS